MINYYFYVLLYSPLVIFVLIFILMLRDNRIHCYIINRNHEVRRKKVNPNLDHFKDRNSIYMIPSDCVTLSSTVKGLNPKSELYFIEDNPLPINFKSITVKDDKGKITDMDPDEWLIDQIWIDKVLTDVGKPRNYNLGFITGYLSDPKKLIMLAFAIVIISALAAPNYAPELLGGIPQ